MTASLPAAGTLAALGLYLARSSALVASAPLLGVGARFEGHKIALIVALSLLLYAATGAPLAEVSAPAYAAMALREVLIGLFLAFSLHLALLAVRVAGEMIGHEMGFLVARQVDPATGVSTSLVAATYEALFLLGLLAVDGHHWLLRALASSYERAPVGELGLSQGLAPAALRLFEQMFEAGVAFAAPVLVLLFLASTLIGLLARAVPHLNVLELGFTVRIVIALGAMALFAPLLAPASERIHRAVERWLDEALVLLGT